MTRDEAIQDQIDQALDWFEWENVKQACEFLIKSGSGFPEEWHDSGTIMLGAIRRSARKLMREVANMEGENCWSMHSYLHVQKWEGTDDIDNKPFITIHLSFVVADTVTQDGTSYDP